MVVEVGDLASWCISFGVLGAQLAFQLILVKCFHMHTRITLDVLDNMTKVENAKETVRNIFANLTLVAALIMTLVFAMFFVSDHLEIGAHKWIHHAYVVSVAWGLLLSVRAMFESVVNILYTEALSSADTIRFLIFGPGSIGAPVVSIGCSILSTFIACTLWLIDMYSVAAAACFSVFAAECLYTLVRFTYKRSKFSTDRREASSKRNWEWAESDADPPRHIANKCDKDEIELMRKRGRAALDHERSHGLGGRFRSVSGIDNAPTLLEQGTDSCNRSLVSCNKEEGAMSQTGAMRLEGDALSGEEQQKIGEV